MVKKIHRPYILGRWSSSSPHLEVVFPFNYVWLLREKLSSLNTLLYYYVCFLKPRFEFCWCLALMIHSSANTSFFVLDWSIFLIKGSGVSFVSFCWCLALMIHWSANASFFVLDWSIFLIKGSGVSGCNSCGDSGSLSYSLSRVLI